MSAWSLDSEISRGSTAIVYSTSNSSIKKKCVAKIELKHNPIEWQRELEFTKQCANKNPKYFSQLVDWKYNDKKQLIKFYTKVDTTLDQQINHMTNCQKLNVLKQILEAIEIMNRLSFAHNDLHDENIGLLINGNQDDSKSKYQIQIIDFGRVLHPSFKLNKSEQQQLKYLLAGGETQTMILSIFTNFHQISEHDYQTQIKKFKRNLKLRQSLAWIQGDLDTKFICYSILFTNQIKTYICEWLVVHILSNETISNPSLITMLNHLPSQKN